MLLSIAILGFVCIIFLGECKAYTVYNVNHLSSIRRSSCFGSKTLKYESNFKMRVDAYLSKSIDGLSRTYISKLCNNNRVFVNGISKGKSFLLKNQDVIIIQLPKAHQNSLNPENISLDILYEDDYFIAINKPAGMIVHPAPSNDNGTFANAFMHHLSSSTHVNNSDSVLFNLLPSKSLPFLRPGIIHRLDKGTSGVLLAAKTHQAVSKFSELFAMRKIRKEYIGISIGDIDLNKFTNNDFLLIDSYIGRSKSNPHLMTTVSTNGDGAVGGKRAVSFVYPFASYENKLTASYITIETGRTHQIRVQLQGIGYPILGDDDYGHVDVNQKFKRLFRLNSSSPFANNVSQRIDMHRPMLHASKVSFIHPYTLQNITITAPPPDDIRRVLDQMTPIQYDAK